VLAAISSEVARGPLLSKALFWSSKRHLRYEEYAQVWARRPRLGRRRVRERGIELHAQDVVCQVSDSEHFDVWHVKEARIKGEIFDSVKALEAEKLKRGRVQRSRG